MAVKDFLHLDEKEYALRISAYSNEQLQKQDVVKQRQCYAGMGSVAAGVGGAFFTGGTTLLASGYGCRRIHVAKRKVKLIHAELRSRGLSPHQQTKRDVLIPLAVCMVSTAIGAGVDIGVGHLMAAPVCHAVSVPVPTGSTAFHTLMANPSEVVHGVAHGIETQTAEVHAGVSAAFANTGVDSTTAAGIAHAQHLIPLDAATALGEYKGELAMKSVEKSLASLLGGLAASRTLNGCLGTEKVKCA